MTGPDGMIAAIARQRRALGDPEFAGLRTTGLELICPWDF